VAASFFFAYGAEMAPDAMADALGRPVRGVRALLRGYRLAFTAYSQEWEGGVADLLEDAEGEVEGLLFSLQPRDLLRLEVAEGWQDPRYRRHPVTVELEDGRTVEAAARVVESKLPSVAPSPAFLDAMVQGATGNGLSEGYVTWLLQLYPDPSTPHRAAWAEDE
jgi:gamma-glutamylcyclotransferase